MSNAVTNAGVATYFEKLQKIAFFLIFFFKELDMTILHIMKMCLLKIHKLIFLDSGQIMKTLVDYTI